MKRYSGQNYVLKCNTIFLQNNIDVEIIAMYCGWFGSVFLIINTARGLDISVKF